MQQKRGEEQSAPATNDSFLARAPQPMPFPLSTFVGLYVSLAKKNRTVPKEDGPKSRSVIHLLFFCSDIVLQKEREDIPTHTSAHRHRENGTTNILSWLFT